MEPVSHLWVGLDPLSTDGTDIPILDLHPGPISAAPGWMRWWSLQQSGLTQTSQLLTAAHDACFPVAAIHCCGAGRCCGDSEPGGDQQTDAVCGGRARHLGNGGGKWESILCHVSSVASSYVAPPPTGGPRCCSQSGLTSLQAHRTALLKQLVTGEATQDMS